MENKLAQLKKKYSASFEQKIKAIEDAWADKDVAQVHGLLHKLSGSSGSYGFSRLSLYCRNGMEKTRDKDKPNESEINLALSKVFNEMKEHIKTH